MSLPFHRWQTNTDDGNAHLYLYTKGMGKGCPKNGGSKVLPLPRARPFTHWAVRVDYRNDDGTTTRVLYEAAKFDRDDHLVAREKNLDARLDKRWRKSKLGFSEEDLGRHCVSEDGAAAFVRAFNRRRLKYW